MSFVCDQTWAGLKGSDKKRRSCDVCDKPVYNLSGMTRKQARALLASYAENPPCVRFVSRNGQIVHDGDPFDQLSEQRHGIKILLAAAMTIPLVYIFDPPLNPFNESGSVFGQTASTQEVMGKMAAPEPDIYFAPGELDVCSSESACIQAVRDAVLRAEDHRQAEGPHALYDEARELTKAERLLESLAFNKRPDDLGNVSVRAHDARSKIEERVRDSRVKVYTLTQHKKYEEARQEFRHVLSLFSDHHNKWASLLVEKERNLIDTYGLSRDPKGAIQTD